MEFWKKWLNIAVVFILTLSLLSPAVVTAEGNELQEPDVEQQEQPVDNLEEDDETRPGTSEPEKGGELEANTVTGIKLNLSEPLTLTVGETQELTATILPENAAKDKTVAWTSSDESVATVTDGLVTAKKAGKTVIKTAVNELSAEIEINVEEVASNLVPPVITVKNYTSTQVVYEPNVTVEVEATDVNGELLDVQFSFGENIYTPNENGHYSLELSEGLNIYYIQATDKWGNTTKQPFMLSYSKIKVIDFVPAVGQFVNTDFTTDYDKKIRSKGGGTVSLGGFGGSVTVEYLEPVKNDPNNPYGIDFTVTGNPFLINGYTDVYNNEPGAVMVANDLNGPWYHLAGSEYDNDDTYIDYEITYNNSVSEGEKVTWTDNKGQSGTFAYGTYPSTEKFPLINPTEYTLSGVSILNNVPSSDIGTANKQVRYGYVDAVPTKNGDHYAPNNPYSPGIQGSGGDGMDISWAVDEQGNPVYLEEIKYVKVYTAVNKFGGSIGELSTEVSEFRRSNSIENNVASISIRNFDKKENMFADEVLQLYVDAKDKDGNETVYPEITWTSSNPEIASVNKYSGQVRSYQNGTTILTATLTVDPTITASYELTVGEKLIPVSMYMSTTMNSTIAVNAISLIQGNVFDQNGEVYKTKPADFTLNYDSDNISSSVVGASHSIKGLKEGHHKVEFNYGNLKRTEILEVVDKSLLKSAGGSLNTTKPVDSKANLTVANTKTAIDYAVANNKSNIFVTPPNMTAGAKDFTSLLIFVPSLQYSYEKNIPMHIESSHYTVVLPEKPTTLMDEKENLTNYQIQFFSQFSKTEHIPEGLKAVGNTQNFSFYFVDSKAVEPKVEITNFPLNQEAQITIKLKEHELDNVDVTKLAAYYFNETEQKWVYVGGNYNEEIQELTFSGANPGKYAIFEDKSISNEKEIINIQVRVEGYNQTILPETNISLEAYDISSVVGNNVVGNWHKTSKTPLAIHAVIKAFQQIGANVEDESQYNFTNGNYIEKLNGLAAMDKGKNSGWQYAVNNIVPNLGIGTYELNDGDSIVVYYVEDYTVDAYTWFDQSHYETDSDVTLTLTGSKMDSNFETVIEPIENAAILINDEPYIVDGIQQKTDVQGQVTLNFTESGNYEISAQVANGSRPYATVSVSVKTLDVSVSIEGLNTTVINKTTKTVRQGTTALSAVEQLLKEQNIPYEILTGSWGPYIQSIAGTEGGSLGGWDGWMYTVNGTALEVGLNEYVLKPEDEVVVYYSKWPSISTKVSSLKDQMITVDLVGDLFTDEATKLENWEISTGETSLTVKSISLETNQQAMITFEGQAKVGTLTVKALAGALSSSSTSNSLEIKVDKQQVNKGDHELAQQLDALIAALPEIEELNETTQLALQQARAAYEKLTEEQKLLVTKLQTLVEKENAYASLVKVEEVIQKINALVEVEHVTWADKEAVQLVVTAYNALTATEKEKVTNKAKLEALQKRLKELEPIIAKSFTIGDKFITLVKVGDVQKTTVTFNPKNTTQTGLTWVSSDENVVTVVDGTFTAVGIGEATITVTSENPALKKAEIKVLVGANLTEAYLNAQQYISSKTTSPKFGSEWSIFTLARANATVDPSLYDTYYANVVKHVQEKQGNLGASYTEYSRLILGLVSIGKDPRDVGGYNLLEKLADYKSVTKQGINGSIYGLLALDTHRFEIPQIEVDDLTTREKLVDEILRLEITGGGFALSGQTPDPDVTAMAIQALAPYKDQPKVKAVIDRALDVLSTIQLANGGYKSWGVENVQSPAQVLIALSTLGIDAATDSRFIKENRATILSNILTYYTTEGGFKHSGNTNQMATIQSVYGLNAYYRMLEGKSSLYDMTDVDLGQGEPQPPEPSTPEEPTQPEKPTTPSEPEKVTITMSITISSSEVVLPSEQFEIQADETAFDVLKHVTQQKQIALNYRMTSMGAYVVGIAGVNEFDRGPLSGWMYKVNGEFPSVSADSYEIQAQDFVEWLYTTDLGKDVGGYIEDIEKDPNEEKTDKDKQEEKEAKTTIVTVDEDAEQFEAELTAETIEQQLQDGVEKIVIQDKNGTKVELPTAALKLSEGEKAIVAVNQQADGNVINVTLAITSQNGSTKELVTGKDYAKVTISAPTASATMVVLQSINGQYRAVPHKIVDGEIVLLVKSGGTFILSEVVVTFPDITKLANKDDIEFLAARHVIKGTEAGTFAPNADITRAQFASMIARALGLQATEAVQFADTKGTWYEADVQALYEAGITAGVSVKAFNPNEKVTHEQAAAFMARVLAYVDFQATATKSSSFKDADSINAQYKQSIELLYSLDIMSGKEDGTFDTAGNLTREQMAKILKRTLTTAGLM